MRPFSPLDSLELPPELMLDKSDWEENQDKWTLEKPTLRRRSVDQPYSILGFIERKVSDKRGRVNSE